MLALLCLDLEVNVSVVHHCSASGNMYLPVHAWLHSCCVADGFVPFFFLQLVR